MNEILSRIHQSIDYLQSIDIIHKQLDIADAMDRFSLEKSVWSIIVFFKNLFRKKNLYDIAFWRNTMENFINGRKNPQTKHLLDFKISIL